MAALQRVVLFEEIAMSERLCFAVVVRMMTAGAVAAILKLMGKLLTVLVVGSVEASYHFQRRREVAV